MSLIKKNNVDIEHAYEEYTEQLKDEFLYPQFGGKEAFEEKMLKKQEKDMRKKPKRK